VLAALRPGGQPMGRVETMMPVIIAVCGLVVCITTIVASVIHDLRVNR
jgi:hypothetical protein